MNQFETQSPAVDALDPAISFRRLEVQSGKTVAVFRKTGSTQGFFPYDSPDPWSENFSRIDEVTLSLDDLERRNLALRQQGHPSPDGGAIQAAIDQIKILQDASILDREHTFAFHRGREPDQEAGGGKVVRIGLLDVTPGVNVSVGELELVDEYDPSSGMNCLRIRSLKALADTGLNKETHPIPQWSPENVAALLLKEAQKFYPNNPIRNNDGNVFAYQGTNIELEDYRKEGAPDTGVSVVHRRIYHYNLHPLVQIKFALAHNEYQILQAIKSIEAHDDGDPSRRPWETAPNMIDAAKIFAEQCYRGRQQYLHRKQPATSRDAINSLTQSRRAPLIDIGNSAGEEESLRILISDCLSGIGATNPIKDPALLSKLATQTANRNSIQLTHRLRLEFEAAYLGELQGYKADLISSDIIEGMPGGATAEEIEAAIKSHAERRGWVDLSSEQGQARHQQVLDQITWPNFTAKPPKDWYLRAGLIGITQADVTRITEIFREAQAEKETAEDQDETDVRERPN